MVIHSDMVARLTHFMNEVRKTALFEARATSKEIVGKYSVV